MGEFALSLMSQSKLIPPGLFDTKARRARMKSTKKKLRDTGPQRHSISSSAFFACSAAVHFFLFA